VQGKLVQQVAAREHVAAAIACDSVLAGEPGLPRTLKPVVRPSKQSLATGLWWSQLSITTFLPRAAASSSFGRLLLLTSCHQVGRAATISVLVSRRETAFGTRPILQSWGSRPAPWSRWAVTISCERKASSRCDTGSRMSQTVVFVTGNSKKLEVCISPCHDRHARPLCCQGLVLCV
jgi:hypothetical protein